MECFAILPENSVKKEIKDKSLVKINCNLNKLNANVAAYFQARFDEVRFKTHLKKAAKLLS
jgi:hypothetical protein